jgi:hypothetical protein
MRQRRDDEGSLGALLQERSDAGRRLPETDRRTVAWPALPVLALLGLSWLVLSWPWLSGQVTIPWDAKAHFLPQIQFLAQSIGRGEAPFWAPYVFSGHPQIADPQAMIFSPPFLALALLDGNPGLRAADATVMVVVLIGAGSIALWFRDRGWHWAGAMIAALGFGFGAAMAWRIQHIGQVLSLVYLAMTLLLLTRALDRGSIGYGLAAGIVGGLMVLGRDQVALLGAYLLMGYVAWWLLADHTLQTSQAGPVEGIGGPAQIARVSSGLGSTRRRGLVARGLHALPPVLAGLLGGIAVVAIPLLLTALVAAESNRPAIDLEGAGRGSLHPALLVTLIAPDIFGAAGRMEDYWGPPSFAWKDTGLYIAQNVGILYVGALPALLVLIGVARGRLWDREIRFFSIATVVAIIYALGWYTPLFKPLHAFVPGVSLFRRPADAVFQIGMLLAILAGYVGHRLLNEPLAHVRVWQAFAAGGVIVAVMATCVAFGIQLDRLPRTYFPLAVAALSFTAAGIALFMALRLKLVRPAAAGLILIGMTVLDLAWGNGPTTSSAMPPSYYDVLQPDTRNETIAILKKKVAETASETRRDRVELLGLGFHWPNASLTHRLENTLGYNPLRLGLYSRVTGADDHVGLPDQRKLSPLFNSFRSPLADLLGLRFIASGAPIETVDKALKPGDLMLIAQTADGFIYENPQALPRVMFATKAQAADFEMLIKQGGWPTSDVAGTVLLEAPPQEPAGPRRAGSVRITSYRNTSVSIEVDSPDGGYVVLNDVWHPWWTGGIDGREVPVLRANVMFRAVAVPQGKHTVRFVFRPLKGLRDTLRGRL